MAHLVLVQGESEALHRLLCGDPVACLERARERGLQRVAKMQGFASRRRLWQVLHGRARHRFPLLGFVFRFRLFLALRRFACLVFRPLFIALFVAFFVFLSYWRRCYAFACPLAIGLDLLAGGTTRGESERGRCQREGLNQV